MTKAGNGREYTTITSIIPEDQSPLHTDASVSQSWVGDELTWADVYSKKPEEYLEMVAKGEVPKWDSETKKWVSNSEESGTLMSPPSNSTKPADPQETDDADDDLPF